MIRIPSHFLHISSTFPPHFLFIPADKTCRIISLVLSLTARQNNSNQNRHTDELHNSLLFVWHIIIIISNLLNLLNVFLTLKFLLILNYLILISNIVILILKHVNDIAEVKCNSMSFHHDNTLCPGGMSTGLESGAPNDVRVGNPGIFGTYSD